MASEADSSTISTSDVVPPMSKNAMKKAAKAKFFAEIKAERRVKEKERKKEKKRQLAERREAGELDEEDEAQLQRMAKKRRLGQKNKKTFQARIVFDMGFDELMADKEIISLTSQLGYVYAANRRAPIPFEKLLFTDVNKRTLARLQSMGDSAYLRWDRCEWWDSSYERLWPSTSNPSSDSTSHNTSQTASTTEAELTETPATAIKEPVSRSSVVYLTADSSEELMELKADETYIIGAIVDHNRYKNLCYDKAVASGVRHARLPIGTYLAGMPTRKVLTVNQVFEILVKWIECRNWEQALDAVIPKRKFKSGDKASSNKTEEQDDGSDTELILNECGCGADDQGRDTGPIIPEESSSKNDMSEENEGLRET